MAHQSELRRELRAKRRNLTQSEQQKAGLDLVEQCNQLQLLQRGHKIAAYLQNDAEISPEYVIEQAWQNQVDVYLPAMHPFCDGYLLFVRYTPTSKLKANRFGILEPIPTPASICPLSELNTILTPLVAFDLSGNRLGMGGGFYDRTLAPVHRDNLPVNIFALAHDCQQTDLIKPQAWDIAVSKIVTPSRIISSAS